MRNAWMKLLPVLVLLFALFMGQLPLFAAGNAGNGGKLYAKKCAACHGKDGAGGKMGPKVKGAAAKKVKDILSKNAKHKGKAKGAEVDDVSAYLQSLK